MAREVMTRSKSIPARIKKLREEKGLGSINTLHLTSSLQQDVDSLDEEKINELWEEYEEYLRES